MGDALLSPSITLHRPINLENKYCSTRNSCVQRRHKSCWNAWSSSYPLLVVHKFWISFHLTCYFPRCRWVQQILKVELCYDIEPGNLYPKEYGYGTYQRESVSRWELIWGCKSCSLCRRIWLPSKLISSNMTDVW